MTHMNMRHAVLLQAFERDVIIEGLGQVIGLAKIERKKMARISLARKM
jgi:hypothetical protein